MIVVAQYSKLVTQQNGTCSIRGTVPLHGVNVIIHVGVVRRQLELAATVGIVPIEGGRQRVGFFRIEIEIADIEFLISFTQLLKSSTQILTVRRLIWFCQEVL